MRNNDVKKNVGTSKCPACGFRMDADAYRCPHCRIYFCFKCRARVTGNDEQYQCANQSCKYYAKLLCSACVAVEPIYEEQKAYYQVAISPAKPMHSRHAWAFWTAIGAGVLVLCFFPFWLAFLAGVATWLSVVIGTYSREDFNWHGFQVPATYETRCQSNNVEMGKRVLCVECRHPVKHLREY